MERNEIEKQLKESGIRQVAYEDCTVPGSTGKQS